MLVYYLFILLIVEIVYELEGDLVKVCVVVYDIVLNGYELGGGSLCIN